MEKHMFRKILVLTLPTAAITATVFSLATAQTTAEPQAYRPGLGDLMTMTVQPRHAKLGLAGLEKNWIYAAYELHELEEAFERAARVWPIYRKTNIAELVVTTTKAPMEAVAAAIKSADAAKFTEAYAQLTATCNACHQSTDRPFVVIQAPKASPFPDQDFRPLKP
jgi:hypothetical protein